MPEVWSDPAAPKVRKGLEALARDRGKWGDFSVTYDDHDTFGQSGGTLTIWGTGEAGASAYQVGALPTRNVSSSDMKQLVNLLLANKAWEWRAENPETVHIPDFGHSVTLTIRYGNDSTIISESTNQTTNQRAGQIGEFMKKVALKE